MASRLRLKRAWSLQRSLQTSLQTKQHPCLTLLDVTSNRTQLKTTGQGYSSRIKVYWQDGSETPCCRGILAHGIRHSAQRFGGKRKRGQKGPSGFAHAAEPISSQ